MAKFSEIIRKNNENLLISKFIELFKFILNKKIESSKRLSFVLTGGESPINLYKELNKTKKIQWKYVDFFMGDERYVNKNSINSNIKMCRKYFLNNKKILKKQIFNITTNRKSIIKDTKAYENKIKKYFNYKKIQFDIILLGIGNDGHIASLFKNNIRTKNKNIVTHVIKKDFKRITLTVGTINNSKSIFLWAPGDKKNKIIKKILLDKRKKYPVSFLRRKNNILFHSN
jgi:6-phosphogluconolactonase